jgi:hypothetical protein
MKRGRLPARARNRNQPEPLRAPASARPTRTRLVPPEAGVTEQELT